MKTGTIKWFSGLRGIGFIIMDDNQKEYFFKVRFLRELNSLFIGEHVSFHITEGNQGEIAVGVKKIV